MDRSQNARSTILRTDSTGSPSPTTDGAEFRERDSGLANGRGRSARKNSRSEGRSTVLPSRPEVAEVHPLVAPSSGISFPFFFSFRSFLGFSCEDEVGASSSGSVVRDGASGEGTGSGKEESGWGRECAVPHRVVDPGTGRVERERRDGRMEREGGTTVS